MNNTAWPLTAMPLSSAPAGNMPIMSSIVAAAISGLIAIGVSLLAQRHQLQQFREGLRTQYMAEAAIGELLDGDHDKRSFDVIRRRIGGFSDDDLRQLLVRSGAVRFYRGRGTSHEVELWGLRARNKSAADTDSD